MKDTTRKTLSFAGEMFRRTGNPIFGVYAYLMAREAKVAPPKWCRIIVDAVLRSLLRTKGGNLLRVGKGKRSLAMQAYNDTRTILALMRATDHDRGYYHRLDRARARGLLGLRRKKEPTALR